MGADTPGCQRRSDQGDVLLRAPEAAALLVDVQDRGERQVAASSPAAPKHRAGCGRGGHRGHPSTLWIGQRHAQPDHTLCRPPPRAADIGPCGPDTSMPFGAGFVGQCSRHSVASFGVDATRLKPLGASPYRSDGAVCSRRPNACPRADARALDRGVSVVRGLPPLQFGRCLVASIVPSNASAGSRCDLGVALRKSRILPHASAFTTIATMAMRSRTPQISLYRFGRRRSVSRFGAARPPGTATTTGTDGRAVPVGVGGRLARVPRKIRYGLRGAHRR